MPPVTLRPKLMLDFLFFISTALNLVEFRIFRCQQFHHFFNVIHAHSTLDEVGIRLSPSCCSVHFDFALMMSLLTTYGVVFAIEISNHSLELNLSVDKK